MSAQQLLAQTVPVAPDRRYADRFTDVAGCISVSAELSPDG